MPTPTGLLRRGDKIRHKETNTVCTVLSREGSVCYSVRIRRDDGSKFQSTGRPERIMTEVEYWLRNGWEVL